eukprot:9787813-Ditylum_brightwellii.AAC.1
MKANYYHMLKENVLDVHKVFQKYPGPLGTYSTREYGMTWSRKNGYHKNEGDYHGHFKAMFDSDFMELVPQAQCHIAVVKYSKIFSHHYIADDENPVEKCCCVAWEHTCIPHIDIINKEDVGDTDGVDEFCNE